MMHIFPKTIKVEDSSLSVLRIWMNLVIMHFLPTDLKLLKNNRMKSILISKDFSFAVDKIIAASHPTH